MKALYNSIGKFAISAFPDSTPQGHIRKMQEEGDEVIENPTDIIEYADCLIALLAASYRQGFSYIDLLNATKNKLEVNKKRSWAKINGLYQHIKHCAK